MYELCGWYEGKVAVEAFLDKEKLGTGLVDLPIVVGCAE